MTNRPSHPPLSGCGLGLRHKHLQHFIENKPDVPWLEVHTENFFSTGSSASKQLQTIREHYPLSMHCVGMSLGTANPDTDKRDHHLGLVKQTIARYQPNLVSDHLSWSVDAHGTALPDLLPVPYTNEALDVVINNIDYVQNYLGRQILLENPSSYLTFKDSPMNEWDFFAQIAKHSGCGILLDVNNIFVSAHNHGFNAETYLNALPVDKVQEIHLAGYSVSTIDGIDVYIDTHGLPVYDPVWDLYTKALKRFGDIPTLIEWDTDVPEFDILLAEKHKADVIRHEVL
jgi:uncharacterized protein (UPF0276 family)